MFVDLIKTPKTRFAKTALMTYTLSLHWRIVINSYLSAKFLIAAH